VALALLAPVSPLGHRMTTLLLVFGPLKTLVLAAAIFVPFERLAAARRDQAILRRGWAIDLLTGAVNGLLLSSITLVILAAIESASIGAMPALREWVASLSLWAQAIAAIVVGDFGTYLMHRLSHTVPWLWRMHAVHHSAEELDWLIGFRFHPADQFFMRVATLAPLVALNFSPAAVAFFVGAGVWQAWLVHANVRTSYGPLEWAFVSPRFHHWHHSAERESFNKNYAGMIAVWDVVCGTAYMPGSRTPQRYGIGEPMPAGYVERLFHPFRRIPKQEQALESCEGAL